MTSRITASLTVSFSSSSSENAGLVLEVDDRDDGLNHGKTSFKPGDNVYYLLYKPSDCDITHHLLTAGSKSSVGSGTRSLTGTNADIISFTDSDSATLHYPAHSAVTFTWIGHYERTDDSSSSISISMTNEQTVTLSGKVVGLLKCEYTSAYSAFRLHGVPLDVDQCMIWVAGEV